MEYSELENIKCAALSYAIKCAAGAECDQTTYFVSSNIDKIIEAAKKFEVYLKGETTNA